MRREFMESLIRLSHVEKIYRTPAGEVRALKDVNFCVQRGEFLGVIGKSGAGKSTLINLITGVDRLTSGEIWIENTPVHAMNQNQMALWRGRNVGVIYQSFELLPQISILDNVILPLDLCGAYQPQNAKRKALELLEQVAIVEHAYKKPTMISGGQQQRVVIARALINDPPIIVADEPTGSLDSKTGEQVVQLFEGLVSDGKTVLMVTHDRSYQERFSRVLHIVDGAVLNQHGSGANHA